LSRSLSSLTSPEVAERIARSPVAVLPFGSIEQHGPHLPCGTDTIVAELVAETLADRLDALYVPFAPYGVTPLHAGLPGTVNLSPATFERLLGEVCANLVDMGVRTLVLVNWHEGNTPSLDRIATDLQREGRASAIVAQACYTAQRVYSEEGGELTHGGGIETMAVMAVDPALAHVERAGEPSRPPGAAELDALRRGSEVYSFVGDVRELANDGWYGNPGWATADRAAKFTTVVADGVLELIDTVLKARDIRRDIRRPQGEKE
jgi:creatinine amidohydrolase